LERAGAEILPSGGDLAHAFCELGRRGIASLLLEGGAALHQAAWDAGLVDLVRLYVTPHHIGAGGVRFLNGRPFAAADLSDRRMEPLGVDVLVEGYVHGSR
jgi:diaminohydroxyphosphoribosylaminopyrimidine deaminase/5-amino-6-(5-phosphoribosylamino)uracil reductase